MKYRRASIDDSRMLAELNHQLIQDEGHRNRMTIPELRDRMASWLTEEYTGIIFEEDGAAVGYALFRDRADEVYLRQLFVVREKRRKGFGREAVQILREEIWPKNKRLTVDVLVTNTRALSFWRAVGYSDYCLTLEILPK